MSVDNLFPKELYPVSDIVDELPSQQTTAAYWLPSVAQVTPYLTSQRLMHILTYRIHYKKIKSISFSLCIF